MNFDLFGDAPVLDWAKFFANENPVEIEIGSGKGAFLLAYAQLHPERNLLGIERQVRWVRLVRERLARAALPNARIVCADAALVVTRFVSEASVAAVHLYFPDPWWKKRHHKRRIVESSFATALFRALVPGGVVHLVTDVGERFEEMLAELSALPFEITRGADRSEMPATNFERKYRVEGRAIYSARLVRPPASGGKTLIS